MSTCCPLPTKTPQQELADLEADLAATAAAIVAAMNGQSYQLNTGQTQLQVTRASLRWLQDREKSLLAEIRALRLRVCGGGAFHGTPNW